MFCDKNEEFAANYLFEQGAMDESAAMNNAVAESMAAAANNNAAGASSSEAQQPQPEANAAEN